MGPQRTLYVPASWLQNGHNEVVVLEMQSGDSRATTGVKEPVFSTGG